MKRGIVGIIAAVFMAIVSLSLISIDAKAAEVLILENIAPGSTISMYAGDPGLQIPEGVDVYMATDDFPYSRKERIFVRTDDPIDGFTTPTKIRTSPYNWVSMGGGTCTVVRNDFYKSNQTITPAPCCEAPAPAPAPEVPVHIHEFVEGTIYDATCTSDGLEGTYCKTCGFVKESRPISAFGFTLEKYAQEKMDAAKSGQKIVLEFGELNSFPKSFMEKIAAKVAAGVSFEFRYMWNHKLQKVIIPAGAVVDTNLDWYGPATMQQLYPQG